MNRVFAVLQASSEAGVELPATPSTVPTPGYYDLDFQGRAGGTDLGKYDLGSDDLGHPSHSRAARSSLMQLREESTIEADYTLDKELKRQGSHLHYDLGYESRVEVAGHQWVGDVDTFLSISNL